MGLRHGTRTRTAKRKSQKSVPILECPVFRKSKIIELFRYHWGGPKQVDEKSIRYVFVQTKNVFGQKSKIIYFFLFSEQRNRPRVRSPNLTVILV